MGVHHVEIWVPDLAGATQRWGWLFAQLSWEPFQEWPVGRSWRDRDSGTYVVLEQSPALRTGSTHDRSAAGLNHIALTVRSRAALDALVDAASEHGWALLFRDRHPHAGGPDHYAAYLEDADGYEVELVAP
jgi:catechol 2,3-dioxygenase-like lactoylglutathione lyase family enzyme